MKVLLLNGSPKSSSSVSETIIDELRKKLGDNNEYNVIRAMGLDKSELLEYIRETDILVVCFPLYVDGIPSHLLRLLYEIKDDLKQSNPDVTVYAIANNGFYEGKQNHVALSMIRHFCESAGIRWGQGLGIGAGGMVGVAPMGYGPMKSIGSALDTLSNSIQNKTKNDDIFVQPNFPKFLYKMGGHRGWRIESKKNGLKRKDLYKRAL